LGGLSIQVIATAMSRPGVVIVPMTTTRKRLWSSTIRTEKVKNVVQLWYDSRFDTQEGPFRAPRKLMTWDFSGADDGIRTRDPNLGKVVLYQLSHVRVR
jgi:hypothetical protein